MDTILRTSERHLLSISPDELRGISNAINEVCSGIHIEDAEFETRLGVSRQFLADLLAKLRADARDELNAYERTEAWADGVSVQVVCVTVFGDAVDMGTSQARAFVERLQQAISEADS